MEVPKDSHQSDQAQETSAEVEPGRESWIRRRWKTLAVLFLAVAVLVTILIITMCSRPGAGDNELAGRTASSLSPGSEVTLYVQGRDSVMVAVDENALDELIRAISTRGSDAQALIQTGKVFTVPNKTRVRIIEASSIKLKVRILEGEKILFEVWVPERWVR